MKLSKRIKHIVALTVDDFYNSGKSTNENKESLIHWLVDDMLKIENIEDLYTYEISIKVLDKLKSLDIVDLGFIHDIVLKLDEVVHNGK
ncbi:MAG: hypothetical protein QG567_181 [Campylobacterota bacterium]|nr:hypothetical protein [Campylobacterota bacterium]